MEQYIKNYYQKWGYSVADTILCEACQAVGVNIHHVTPRSHFGSRQKEERDNWANLVCLCGKCHDIAHAGPNIQEFNDKLKELVSKRNSI